MTIEIETGSGSEKTKTVIDDVDVLLWAIGRSPNTEIALDKVVSHHLLTCPYTLPGMFEPQMYSEAVFTEFV